jgi:hypothetical protein
MHLRTSTVHNNRTHRCPGRGCNRSFAAYSDLALHLEAGTCSSGVNRRSLDDVVIRSDRNHSLTNPNRLIGYRQEGVINTWATERAWNGWDYECSLCHRTFQTLPSLNAHLSSPAHTASIYRCPPQHNGCGLEFKTLSAVLSHIERSQCGVTRFRKQVTGVLDGVTQGMRMLTF